MQGTISATPSIATPPGKPQAGAQVMADPSETPPPETVEAPAASEPLSAAVEEETPPPPQEEAITQDPEPTLSAPGGASQPADDVAAAASIFAIGGKDEEKTESAETKESMGNLMDEIADDPGFNIGSVQSDLGKDEGVSVPASGANEDFAMGIAAMATGKSEAEAPADDEVTRSSQATRGIGEAADHHARQAARKRDPLTERPAFARKRKKSKQPVKQAFGVSERDQRWQKFQQDSNTLLADSINLVKSLDEQLEQVLYFLTIVGNERMEEPRSAHERELEEANERVLDAQLAINNSSPGSDDHQQALVELENAKKALTSVKYDRPPLDTPLFRPLFHGVPGHENAEAKKEASERYMSRRFAPAVREFTSRLADKLGLHIDGTTLVKETASADFQAHAPLNVLYNDSELGDLLDLLSGARAKVSKGEFEDKMNELQQSSSKLAASLPQPFTTSNYTEFFSTPGTWVSDVNGREEFVLKKQAKRDQRGNPQFDVKRYTAAEANAIFDLNASLLKGTSKFCKWSPLYEPVERAIQAIGEEAEKAEKNTPTWNKLQLLSYLGERDFLELFPKGDPSGREWIPTVFENVFGGFRELRQRRNKIRSDTREVVEKFEALRNSSDWDDPNDSEKQLEYKYAAIKAVGYLQAAFHGVPIEPPIRLPEYYHEIDGEDRHLKQHYYRNQYLPLSHPLRAPMDSQLGVDRYRDDFIQRPHHSKRILESRLKLSYHSWYQWKKGSFPLLNFPHLNQIEPRRYRIGIRKSTFVNVTAQANYQIKTYRTVASNFKLTSNRTADMFLAREMGVLYRTERVM